MGGEGLRYGRKDGWRNGWVDGISLFYVIDTGSIGSRARIEMGVTYLPFTVSSDAGYADLPLPLLGAPVSIGALVKLGYPSEKLIGVGWIHQT